MVDLKVGKKTSNECGVPACKIFMVWTMKAMPGIDQEDQV